MFKLTLKSYLFSETSIVDSCNVSWYPFFAVCSYTWWYSHLVQQVACVIQYKWCEKSEKLASINLVGPTYNILLDKLKVKIIWKKSLGFGNYIKCNLNAFKLHLTQSLKYLLAEWDIYQDNKVIKFEFSGRKVPPVILAKGSAVMEVR